MRFLLALLVLAGCQAYSPETAETRRPELPPITTDLAIAKPPYDQVEVQWKHRIDQPYVFLESKGSYTGIGRLLERAFAEASAQGIAPAGPPFALYFDDPGSTPVAELRMRACLPLDRPATPREPLGYEVLESTTVVYAFAAGPYPDVPRVYPALFDYMRRLDWIEHGPIREVYLRNPADVESWNDLVTEVQIPTAPAR